MFKAELTRRDFVSRSAAAAVALAAVGLAGCAGKGQSDQAADWPEKPEPQAQAAVEKPSLTEVWGAEPAAKPAGGTWIAQYCSACHAPNCGTLVRVENGVAMEIKGDPASPH